MTNWKGIHPDFTPELQKEWEDKGLNHEQAKEWISIGLNSSDADYAHWLRDKVKLTPEKMLSEDSEELRKLYIEYSKNWEHVAVKKNPIVGEKNKKKLVSKLLSNPGIAAPVIVMPTIPSTGTFYLPIKQKNNRKSRYHQKHLRKPPNFDTYLHSSTSSTASNIKFMKKTPTPSIISDDTLVDYESFYGYGFSSGNKASTPKVRFIEDDGAPVNSSSVDDWDDISEDEEGEDCILIPQQSPPHHYNYYKKTENITVKSKKNDELQKQLQEISNIVLPNSPFEFAVLKSEIEKLKNESLDYQIQIRKTELNKLVGKTKNRLDKESEFLLETLLEIQKDIIKLGNDSFIKRLKDLESLLNKRKIGSEEIRLICQKQKEITCLEEAAQFLETSQTQDKSNDIQNYIIEPKLKKKEIEQQEYQIWTEIVPKNC